MELGEPQQRHKTSTCSTTSTCHSSRGVFHKVARLCYPCQHIDRSELSYANAYILNIGCIHGSVSWLDLFPFLELLHSRWTLAMISGGLGGAGGAETCFEWAHFHRPDRPQRPPWNLGRPDDLARSVVSWKKEGTAYPSVLCCASRDKAARDGIRNNEWPQKGQAVRTSVGGQPTKAPLKLKSANAVCGTAIICNPLRAAAAGMDQNHQNSRTAGQAREIDPQSLAANQAWLSAWLSAWFQAGRRDGEPPTSPATANQQPSATGFPGCAAQNVSSDEQVPLDPPWAPLPARG